MQYTRTNLVTQAVDWLVNWNYKAFLQEVNEPHPDDYLSEGAIDYTYKVLTYHDEYGCTRPYSVRTKADAHDALENIISSWGYGLDDHTPEVCKMVNYYVSLSDKGFNRLFNEVTRKAEKRLQIKEDAYWARKMLAKRGVEYGG